MKTKIILGILLIGTAFTFVQVVSAQSQSLWFVSSGGVRPVVSSFDVHTRDEMRFYDANASNYVGFTASSTVASDIVWRLPVIDGTADQVLTTNGNLDLSWAAVSAGANTALSNLASVAINTSLISDADSTDNLGSSAFLWSNLFIDNITGTSVVVFNDDQDDLDFRFEGDSIDDLLFIDSNLLTIAIGTDTPFNHATNSDVAMHIFGGNAGTSTCEAITVLCVETDGNMAFQLVTGAASDISIFFGDGADPDEGLIKYFNNGDIMTFETKNIETLRLDNLLITLNLDTVSNNDSQDAFGSSSVFWDEGFFDELILSNATAAATAADTIRLSAVDIVGGDAAFQVVSEDDTAYTFGAYADFGGPIVQTTSTIAADDDTPDVSGGNYFITSVNLLATAITDLDLPTVGQEVCIIGGSNSTSTTIADSGNFNLTGAFTASLDDMLCVYVQADNDYIEISRSDN